jgi:hypothetical protein
MDSVLTFCAAASIVLRLESYAFDVMAFAGDGPREVAGVFCVEVRGLSPYNFGGGAAELNDFAINRSF